jgi:hypothetical protein
MLLSVIIPAHNEEEGLRETVVALVRHAAKWTLFLGKIQGIDLILAPRYLPVPSVNTSQTECRQFLHICLSDPVVRVWMTMDLPLEIRIVPHEEGTPIPHSRLLGSGVVCEF